MKHIKGETDHIIMENHQFTKVYRNKGKESVEIQNNQKANDKIVVISPCMSIITLIVNDLSSPIKSHGVTGWIKAKKKKQ